MRLLPKGHIAHTFSLEMSMLALQRAVQLAAKTNEEEEEEPLLK